MTLDDLDRAQKHRSDLKNDHDRRRPQRKMNHPWILTLAAVLFLLWVVFG